MKRNWLIHILIVLAVGEAVLRFDQATLFFQGKRFAVLADRPRESVELTMIRNGTFPIDPSVLRAMVVGDSFLYGGKVESDAIFSNRLETLLRSENLPGFRGASVLDLCTPAANTRRNRMSFDDYVDRFEPQILVWAYSRNDVYKEEGANEGGDRPAAALREENQSGRSLHDRASAVARASQKFLFDKIKVSKWILKTINTELKLKGIVLPGTPHHHLVRRSHDDGYPGWRQTRRQMEEVAKKCDDDGIRMLVFNVPYFHMLENYGIYEEQDAIIRSFFEGIGADYMNGIDPFRSDRKGKYAISRFDFQPNEAAHGVIADAVHRRILDGPSAISD